MRKTSRVILTVAALTMGSLFATNTGTGVGGGCFNLGTEAFMVSIDPCSILDCDDGLFGGAIDWCGQPGNAADDILVGCP